MKVQLTETKKFNKIAILYIFVLIVCVTAIGVALYEYYSHEEIDNTNQLSPEEEAIEELKTKLEVDYTSDFEDEQIKTVYQMQEKSSNDYDINVNIPSFNIESELATKYNEEIKNSFQIQADYIKKTKNRNIAYSVNYLANKENDILSLSILATFKEGENVQRTMVKTYNYNLNNNSEATLSELIKLKNIEETEVQNKIQTEIQKSQEQTEKLKELGYEIYGKDISDPMYKIQNTTEYYFYNNHLYIIYAYGNENLTSEMDIVII